MIRAVPIASLCFVALGGVYLAKSLELPMGSAARPGAGLYPLLVGIALIVLSVSFLIQSYQAKETQPDREESFPKGKDRQRVVAVAAALFFFVLFLNPLGYLICSIALMGAILRLLGLRSWGKIVFISIVTAGLSYYLFFSILGVPLPRGFFSF
ncbi:MAG: tripartite tricarboxylate transporter TctB family protein [Deltaproteobacteria bacterium]|nr:tripartite tricarboxylate transporter TctB family protein [Deltaproteobacteria bacterium]